MTRAEQLAALLSGPGAELLARLGQQPLAPGDALRLGTELRAEYPAELVAAALAQHELRIAAQAKFSRAMQMFFTRDGLEQASAEVVARHRRGRYPAGGVLADLCCGIGGDLIALAGGHQVRAVDADPLHLRIAQANAAVYGVAGGVRFERRDVRDTDLDGVTAAFIDPARRTGRGRLRPGASEPPLAWCLDLAGQVSALGIKAAPGIPREAVPPGWEAEFIAVGRELKEAALWSPALARSATRATILPGGHTLTPQAGPPVPVAPPGPFLLDPNPAVTRAGLVAELARATGRLADRRADRVPVHRRAGAYPVRPHPPGARLRPLASARAVRPAARAGHRLGGHPPPRPARRRQPDPAAAQAVRPRPGHPDHDPRRRPPLGPHLPGPALARPRRPAVGAMGVLC